MVGKSLCGPVGFTSGVLALLFLSPSSDNTSFGMWDRSHEIIQHDSI